MKQFITNSINSEQGILAEERLRRIGEILNKNGSVKIDELAKTFHVSEMTIRRDLEKCQKLGISQRCRGGAMLKREILPEVELDDRRFCNMPEKQWIAEACIPLVSPNSIVYLDAGTTTGCIAELIGNISGITIITNDIHIALQLLKSGATVQVLGGWLQKSSGSLLGEQVSRAIENLRVDIAFVGGAAVDDQFYTLTPTLEKAFLRRAVRAIANEAFLVVDASKFHCQSTYCINHLSDYTGVVTNMQFTPQEWREIEKKGINIISV